MLETPWGVDAAQVGDDQHIGPKLRVLGRHAHLLEHGGDGGLQVFPGNHRGLIQTDTKLGQHSAPPVRPEGGFAGSKYTCGSIAPTGGAGLPNPYRDGRMEPARRRVERAT